MATDQTNGYWRILLLGGRFDPRRWLGYGEMGAFANLKYGAGMWTGSWEPRLNENPVEIHDQEAAQ